MHTSTRGLIEKLPRVVEMSREYVPPPKKRKKITPPKFKSLPLKNDQVAVFNPFEKYESKWIISPNRGENKKWLKPPPSDGWKMIFLLGPGNFSGASC